MIHGVELSFYDIGIANFYNLVYYYSRYVIYEYFEKGILLWQSYYTEK